MEIIGTKRNRYTTRRDHVKYSAQERTVVTLIGFSPIVPEHLSLNFFTFLWN